MVVTIFGGDLRTGLIRVRNIAAENGSCGVSLGAAGSIGAGVKLPMMDPLTDKVLKLPEILIPGRSFLAWEEDGVILNAGPIWSQQYSFDTRKLQMDAAGLRSYWDYRFVLPLLNDADPNSLPSGKDTVFLTTDGLHLRTIAKRLVQQAQLWTAGSVPVVFEADFPGDAARTYKGHELHVVNEKLKQISEVQNGPDIMFNPRYTNANRTHIEWLMETGNPQIHQLPIVTTIRNRVPNPAYGSTAFFIGTNATLSVITGSQRATATGAGAVYTYPTAAPADASPTNTVRFGVTPAMKIGASVIVKNNNATTQYVQLRGTSYIVSTGSGPSILSPVVEVPAGQERTLTITGNVDATAGVDGFLPIVYVTDAAGTLPTTPAGVTLDTRDWSFYSTIVPEPMVFIRGDMTDTTGVDYSWQGTAYQSPSLRTTTRIVAHKWDASGLPNPSVKGATITRDASELTTDNYQTGSTPDMDDADPDADGEEEVYPLIAKAVDSYLTDPTRMFPRLESSTDRSSVINLPVLQAGADAAVQVGRKVTETWKFMAKKDVVPKITDYRVGHYGKFVTKNDPLVGSGEHSVRIMEINTTLENAFATLSCAPSREDI
ncbi:minor tail protein [Microbacterium phage ValentiniPuff]|uniref:Minor tail protein n=1 Tax=Microbacterium phage ValentiniPuff TaxID=2315705 RepID=A0A386KPK1_9CAUD|nr:minor tail protein [Microbacterium phage ValentiniPuff]